jgi:hypothetical protein
VTSDDVTAYVSSLCQEKLGNLFTEDVGGFDLVDVEADGGAGLGLWSKCDIISSCKCICL